MPVLAAASPRPVDALAAGALSDADARELRVVFRGRVILPGDDEYDVARQIHNSRFDRRPAAIVRPLDAVEVSRAILLARGIGLEIAVRGGGHSVAGHSLVDGGMVIDLRDMRSVDIDPIRRTGSAQGGATAGELTVAAHHHGFAVPLGDTSSVGLGGLTLGGGIGWLVRKHGLTLDALLAADLVTADGDLVTVSPGEDPELFWAIRGGGGNFGVATRLTYRLSPVDVITGGALVLPATRDVLRGLVPVAAAAPEELSVIVMIMTAPPAPFIPAEHHGRPVVVAMMVHAGDLAAGLAAVAPFRRLATPIADTVAPMRYPDIYQLTAGGAQRGPAIIRSAFAAGLDDRAIDGILDRLEGPGARPAMVQLRVLGGTMARVPAGATAFAHRDAAVAVAVIMRAGEDVAADEAWADAYLSVLVPRPIGAYSNFLADEGEARLRTAYPGTTHERLVRVKRRIDPSNVFHGNHNIRPD